MPGTSVHNGQVSEAARLQNIQNNLLRRFAYALEASA